MTPFDNQPLLDLHSLGRSLVDTRLVHHWSDLESAAAHALAQINHGDLPKWRAAVESLPDIGSVLFDPSDTVSVVPKSPLSDNLRQQLHDSLWSLRPWRKGPYAIGGTVIDTEWRSDWKWQRLADSIEPLSGRTVLDVGCGSGYHLWRMRESEAKCVIGIDPGLLFLMQFNAVQRYVQDASCHFLPMTLEKLPPLPAAFDTVFSMGILYHRRDPEAHLSCLFELLRPGGELVLETLILADSTSPSLHPSGRYARMRNVWEIPSVPRLEQQLKHCGFSDIRQVSESITSTDEQRTTAWMPFESLAQALLPDDPTRTIEGHPAPRRAVILANRPG